MDRWGNSIKGSKDNYGRGEDWIKGLKINEQITVGTDQLSATLDLGIYSTHENNGGAYFSMIIKQGIGGDLVSGTSSFEPEISASTGFSASTVGLDFKPGRDFTHSKYLEFGREVTAGPLILQNTEQIDLETLKSSQTFDMRVSNIRFKDYEPELKITTGVYEEFNLTWATGTIRLTGGR